MCMKRDKQTPWKQLLTIWTTSFLLQDVICMVIYVVLLLPGFLQMAWFYVKTDRISVRYKADSCRNSLDIYSNKSQQARPVVLFLPGGAFLIGYKMWAALLAQALAPAGILVIAADYRNYPFGTVPDMVQDVDDVLEWTFENCEAYGGDPTKVVLVGQSAGAHLGIVALLRRQWDIKGFIGLSGVYDLRDATKLFGRHGLSAKFVKERLFDNRMTECDPTQILREEGKNLPLPPIEIWHGTADKTIDWRSSKQFASELEQCNSNIHFKAYPNWTHTDAIIEAIFEGNHAFHYDLCCCIETWCKVRIEFQPPPNSPRCPRLLVQLARKFSPF